MWGPAGEHSGGEEKLSKNLKSNEKVSIYDYFDRKFRFIQKFKKHFSKPVSHRSQIFGQRFQKMKYALVNGAFLHIFKIFSNIEFRAKILAIR